MSQAAKGAGRKRQRGPADGTLRDGGNSDWYAADAFGILRIPGVGRIAFDEGAVRHSECIRQLSRTVSRRPIMVTLQDVDLTDDNELDESKLVALQLIAQYMSCGATLPGEPTQRLCGADESPTGMRVKTHFLLYASELGCRRGPLLEEVARAILQDEVGHPVAEVGGASDELLRSLGWIVWLARIAGAGSRAAVLEYANAIAARLGADRQWFTTRIDPATCLEIRGLAIRGLLLPPIGPDGTGPRPSAALPKLRVVMDLTMQLFHN